MASIPNQPKGKHQRATVISDASFCPDTRAAGWAAWVSMTGNHKIKRSATFKQLPKHSTEAEYWAALNGIWLAFQAGASDILIQTDCLSVVNRINNGDKELNRFHRCRVRARHVRGHTNRKEPRFFVNRWCDEHARKHMLRQRKQLK